MKTSRVFSVLSAVALNLAIAGAAAAAPHGIFWAKGKAPARSHAGGNLQYFGGPVIQNAKVTAVFWGDTVDKETQKNIGPFFTNMLDSTYMDWLSEYDTNLTAVDGRQGTAQHIGRGSFAGKVTIRPTTAAKALTDAMVQQELESQVAAGKLPKPDGDSLYMIYFPAGVSITIEGQRSCSAFCAYHEGFKSARLGSSVFYGVMPSCAASCAFGNTPFDSMSIVSSHEAIEAVTDPFPTPGSSPAYPQAWNDPGGEEIGDLCAEGSSTVTGRDLVSKVQWEWDNATTACAKGPWKQSASALARAAWTAPDLPHPLLDAVRKRPESFFEGR